MAGLGVVLGFAVAIILWLVLARAARRSAVEKLESRVLLLVGIFNTVLAALFAFFHGTLELVGLAHSGAWTWSSLLSAIFLCSFAAIAVWNYFLLPRRVGRILGARTADSPDLSDQVRKFCQGIGSVAPAVCVSERLAHPRLFRGEWGRPALVLPASWNDLESQERRIEVLHELAHISNGDVGFTTWAWALRRGIWLAAAGTGGLALLTALVGAEGLAAVSRIAGFYCFVLVGLAVLYSVVLRKRELLADLTAGLVSGCDEVWKVRQGAISSAATSLASPREKMVSLSVRWRNALQRWLADVALFGRWRRLWVTLSGVLFYVSAAYPRPDEVKQALKDLERGTKGTAPAGWETALWAGFSVGMFAVMLSSFGVVWARYVLGRDQPLEVIRVPYEWSRICLPVLMGYASIVLALPIWATGGVRVPSWQCFRYAFIRYMACGLGALAALPLSLLAGRYGAEAEPVFLCTVLGTGFVLLFTPPLSVLTISLWREVLYWRRRNWRELLFAAPRLSSVTLHALAWVGGGLLVLLLHSALLGGILAGSGVIGLWLTVSLILGGRTSREDRFLTVRFGPWTRRYEGPSLGWPLWVAVNALIAVTATCVAAVLAFVTYRVVQLWSGTIHPLGSVLAVLLVALIAFLILTRTTAVRAEVRYKLLYDVAHALALTGEKLPRLQQRALQVLRDRHIDHLAPDRADCYEVPTCERVFYLSALNDGSKKDEWWRAVRKWLKSCRCSGGGYGLWPGSSPRLSCTHFAIGMLSCAGGVAASEADEHIRWILSWQRPEGSFRGPWSKREETEDTFFAVSTLKMLGAHLPEDRRRCCLLWTTAQLKDALVCGEAEALHWCVGSLAGIGAVTIEIRDSLRPWLLVHLRQILLGDLRREAAPVHQLLATCDLLQLPLPLLLPDAVRTTLVKRLRRALDAVLIQYAL